MNPSEEQPENMNMEDDNRKTSSEPVVEEEAVVDDDELDLEPDFEVARAATKRTAIGKMIGRKTLAKGALTKALSFIWITSAWRIQRLKEGFFSFTFQSDRICAEVLRGRPWNINGILLNLVG